ncbi:MAG TPA: hypothetical protein VG457_06235 [Planctomycetota bacterium]|nr:hypothetical protein [Planctomycetota bacterium]
MKTAPLALLLAALTQGAPVDQGRIDGAVRKGLAYLKTAKTPPVEFARISDTSELVLLTFVHGGVPESDDTFQEYFRRMMNGPLERTYKVALQAMILEDLDRVKFQSRIAQCAQFLVDNQCGNGQWSYGEPTAYVKDPGPAKEVATPAPPRDGAREFGPSGRKEKPKVKSRIPVRKMKEGPATGDNSNSQYAALGLRACHDAGIVLPKESIQLARRWWIESQHETGEEKGVATGGDLPGTPRGWCYSKQTVCAKNHRAYASMTAGAVGALAICDFILDQDRKKDPAIRSGLAWLSAHWSVTANEGPVEFDTSTRTELFYFLYALERAGMLVDLPTVGKHDWYGEGASAILEVQKADGSWSGGAPRCNPTWDTCFAILFLKKATARLEVASEDRVRKWAAKGSVPSGWPLRCWFSGWAPPTLRTPRSPGTSSSSRRRSARC